MLNWVFCSRHLNAEAVYYGNWLHTCMWNKTCLEIKRWAIYTVSTKSKPKFFLATALKLFTNFRQIWQVAAAINVVQCVLKLFTSLCPHNNATANPAVRSPNFEQNLTLSVFQSSLCFLKSKGQIIKHCLCCSNFISRVMPTKWSLAEVPGVDWNRCDLENWSGWIFMCVRTLTQ